MPKIVIHQAALLVTVSIFTLLTIIVVACRLLTRLFIIRNTGRDELAIVFSMIAAIGMVIAMFFQIKHGLGRHIITLEPEEFERQLEWLWISILFYTSSLTLTKLSIILQYIRVFPSKGMHRVCLGGIGLVVIFAAVAYPTTSFSCTPVSAFWTGKGVCGNKTVSWMLNAILNILSDLFLLLLPIPVLNSLRLAKRQKIGLRIVFGLGGVVTMVSFLRLHSLNVTANSNDVSYDNINSAIWSAVEVNLGIICACLPTLKPLVSRCFPHLLLSNRKELTLTTIPYDYPGEQLNSTTLLSLPPAKLADREITHITTTRVSAIERRPSDLEMGSKREEEIWKDIFVTREIVQDIEPNGNQGRRGSEVNRDEIRLAPRSYVPTSAQQPENRQ